MISLRKTAAIATFATLMLGPLAAAAATIACPHTQIRREVTTALPSGWWNTPIVNSLKSTRVQNIGGKPALICDYGPAGTIQRYAPEGQSCTARGRGFTCASAGPRTHSTGPLDIPQTYLADLDRGQVTQHGADIWFQAETASRLYLVPRNGAKLGVGNRRNRGYAGCSGARYSNARVSLGDIPVGSYVCVRTNEGRISQFRVNGLTGGSPKTLKLGYTTWQ
ncbi:Serine/threonine protein kinase [Candidatus Rhodobacter oscarellae]|uniref:Serine/threonine protein kinase n=1 Tax=Candidatus Rhodobacter oscarellae TaxID=1675527 RepID=A0A0J9E1A3_9RHOB|nr:hypothetical protein [Candidatus Rhodobacter lobularis]KMW56661.1 Serine/threonine protein kinase [Candidatus Rhodobacter lobularis]